MNLERLRILQVNALDTGGGASQLAQRLFNAYRVLGHASYLAVGHKSIDDPNAILIGRQAGDRAPAREAVSQGMSKIQRRLPLISGLHFWLGSIAAGRPGIERALGIEDFNFPNSRRLLELVPEPPDIVHAHVLHGGYFDLRYLAELSRRQPIVLTLQDAWLLSGHCAHSFACERWRSGCGRCPDLTIYPAIRHDATAYNWRRKRSIYGHSRLYLAAPSDWLMQKIKASMLWPACAGSRVIPNGVDLDVFHRGDRAEARALLGLPQDVQIVLFAARGIRNSPWRDFRSMKAAVEELAARLAGRRLLLLALGEEAPGERAGGAEVRYVPWQSSPAVVARYYQAADVYLHSAKVDTFPGVVLEALACGTPVVATAVGGIPEQIRHGETGFLTPPADVAALAHFCSQVIEDSTLARTMGEAAARDTATRFDFKVQVRAYLDWYGEILAVREDGNPTSTAGPVARRAG